MSEDSTTTAAAILNESHKLFINSWLAKNFSYQCSVTPTGGNWMYGVGLSENMATTINGPSKNPRMQPLTPQYVHRPQDAGRVLTRDPPAGRAEPARDCKQ